MQTMWSVTGGSGNDQWSVEASESNPPCVARLTFHNMVVMFSLDNK